MKKTREIRTQADKFKDAARKVGVSENENAFDEALKRIAKQNQTKVKKAK